MLTRVALGCGHTERIWNWRRQNSKLASLEELLKLLLFGQKGIMPTWEQEEQLTLLKSKVLLRVWHWCHNIMITETKAPATDSLESRSLIWRSFAPFSSKMYSSNHNAACLRGNKANKHQSKLCFSSSGNMRELTLCRADGNDIWFKCICNQYQNRSGDNFR